MAIGSDLLALPFPDVVAQLAASIAQAQEQLDKNTIDRLIAVVNALKAAQPSAEGDAGEALEDSLIKLKAAGLLPTFYQFLDTELEVRMAISTSKESGLSASAGVRLTAVTVDASYSQKYAYKAEGSSVLRTKLVPVAPPAQLKELLEAANSHRLLDLKLPASLAPPAPAPTPALPATPPTPNPGG